MCTEYTGVNYRYAFEFTVPVENSSKNFSIAISDFRQDTQDFSGICLENGIRVISTKKILFMAFFDIVSSIVDITLQAEKAYKENHQGQQSVSFIQVNDSKFLKQFEERKELGKSLDYYMKLRGYLEKPETIPEDFSDEKKFDLCDCPMMLFFDGLIRAKVPQIKDIVFFRI